jgi:hypothetical protein
VVTGIIVGLEPDGSAVHSAGLGTVDGVVLSFTEGAPGNTATATKTGNFYKITGTATGVDNAGQQVSKPFEVDAPSRPTPPATPSRPWPATLYPVCRADCTAARLRL